MDGSIDRPEGKVLNSWEIDLSSPPSPFEKEAPGILRSLERTEHLDADSRNDSILVLASCVTDAQPVSDYHEPRQQG